MKPVLSENGLKVATVKHDGHTFEPDVPGTDSYRFFQAGAWASLIYDNRKYSLTRQAGITEEEAPGLLPEADIVLLEVFKWSGYPKMEIVRKENGKGPIPDMQGRIAYISDMELSEDDSLPVLKPWNIRVIAEFIRKAYVNGTLKERWKNEEDR